MEAFVGLLMMAAIVFLIAGPVAILLTIVLFSKVNNLQQRLDKIEGRHMPGVDYQTSPVTEPEPAPTPVQPEIFFPPAPPEPIQPISQPEPEPQPTPVETPPVTVPEEAKEVAAAMEAFPVSQAKPSDKGGLELKIGTTVTLIVGVITVVFGVGYFLKHIYETMTFGPIARVSMVAGGGLLALIVGEIIRRKDFGIVAKGITALGFALLYAAVFSGSRVYTLFSIELAFIMSIIITAVAMAYAVGLNEVIIAFLAILGGYLSPIIISSGQNLPMPLFSYVLVLSVGAMGCAMFRRWRAVNWVAMVGTYLLYTAWFEKFYDDPQMAIALSWLGVFGGIYLVLPILNGLVKKLTARAEDVALVVANSVIVYYHLWRILYNGDAKNLAVASVILGVVHLVTIFIVVFRSREDEKLQAALGVLGTAFITAALPMYFKLDAAVIGWAIEAVVLSFIGIHYRSMWTKVMAFLVACISSAGLFYHLPLHLGAEFEVFFNRPFMTWMTVAAILLIAHLLWRFIRTDEHEENALMAEIIYLLCIGLASTAIALEWYAYCDWQIEYVRQGEQSFLVGIMLLAAAVVTLLLARPVPPTGPLVRNLGSLTALAGMVFTFFAMTDIYYQEFRMFVNGPFAAAFIYVVISLLAAWILKGIEKRTEGKLCWSSVLAVSTLLILWGLLSQQVFSFWYCKDAFGHDNIENWKFSAQMYMSVMWAVYGAVLLVVGFIARARNVRYLSLMVFAVLLGKIFIVDTATLRTEYRITAFITTGLVLVGVSFLYQMLKKKGFFDAMEKQILNTEGEE